MSICEFIFCFSFAFILLSFILPYWKIIVDAFKELFKF